MPFNISNVELRGGTRVSVTLPQQTFGSSSSVQTYTVPPGVTLLRATVAGAPGGATSASGGGAGAVLQTLIPVYPGQTLWLVVPQAQPANQRQPRALGGGGWGGIEDEFLFPDKDAGAGGGYSGIFWHSDITQETAMIVAGGGGGGSSGDNGRGGNAGTNYPGNAYDGQTADDFWGHNGGYGATVSGPGAPGRQVDLFADDPTGGSALGGGKGASNGANAAGGGGGGGWWGGGGAAAGLLAYGGGGGGSSWSRYPAKYLGARSSGGGEIILQPVELMTPVDFYYTGAPQSWTVPGGVESLMVNLRGGSGGWPTQAATLLTPTQLTSTVSPGSRLSVMLSTSAGTNYNIVVGSCPGTNRTPTGTGAGGPGGLIASDTTLSGGAGGGYSGIFAGSPSPGSTRALAGGGGGMAISGGTVYYGGRAGISDGTTNNTNGESGSGSGSGGGGGGGINNTGGTAGSSAIPSGGGPIPATAGGQLTGGSGGGASGTTSGLGGGGGGGAGWWGGGGGGGGGYGGGGGSAQYDSGQYYSTWSGNEMLITFDYTGSIQTWTVPPGVTQITVGAWGAAGGCSPYDRSIKGGPAVGISALREVTPGQVLYIVVGGHPWNSSQPTPIGGGGRGGAFYTTVDDIPDVGAAGGGYSGVFITPQPSTNYSDYLIIGGGGGGASGAYTGGSAGVTSIGISTGYNGGNGSSGIGAAGGFGGTAVSGFAYSAVPIPPPSNPQSATATPGYQLVGGNGGQKIGGITTGWGGGGGGGGYTGGSGGLSGGTNNNGGGGGGASSLGGACAPSNIYLRGATQLPARGVHDHGLVQIRFSAAYLDGYVRVSQGT